MSLATVKWPPIRMLLLIAGMMNLLQGDIIGPPEYRFVKLNVTMPAPLVTDVTEVDVTVSNEAART